VRGEVATSHVDALDGMGDGKTFVDGHGVGNAIARVKDDTSCAAGSIEGANALHADVKARNVEDLKHDLSHLFTVSLGVKRGFGHEERVLFGGNSQLIVKSVVPDLLHVVPVGHDSMFNGLLNAENAALLLGLTSYVDFLLVETDHDSGDLGPSHNSGED
jgi:hypothetical protein